VIEEKEAAPESNVIDLMEALRRSLRGGGDAKAEAPRAGSKAAKPTRKAAAKPPAKPEPEPAAAPSKRRVAGRKS
ncbi:MAG: Ku protein, partial [Janthinobacterium lividum]